MPYSRREKRCKGIRKIPRFWMIVLALSLGAAAFATIRLVTDLNTYASARNEYEILRVNSAPDVPALEAPKDPAEINQEYVGWLRVAGTAIDYPVAQGKDNNKYLTISFSGQKNMLGAIFLDYRCVGAFEAPHAVVYGHNAKDGSMFGGLAQLLNTEQYPNITITLPSGQNLTYRIFDVRKTDVTDAAYRWEFENMDDFADFAAKIGAPYRRLLPEGTAQILTLSTCTSDGSNDARLLVHAALE